MKYPLTIKLVRQSRDSIAGLTPLHRFKFGKDGSAEFEPLALEDIDYKVDLSGPFVPPISFAFINPISSDWIYPEVLVTPWMDTLFPILSEYKLFLSSSGHPWFGSLYTSDSKGQICTHEVSLGTIEEDTEPRHLQYSKSYVGAIMAIGF